MQAGEDAEDAEGHARGRRRREGRAYGDKTDYPKIDVFVDGKYAISTTWVPTCREAVERYLERYPGTRGRVIASFDPRSRKRR